MALLQALGFIFSSCLVSWAYGAVLKTPWKGLELKHISQMFLLPSPQIHSSNYF